MKLKYEAKNGWEVKEKMNNLENVMNYSKGYIDFLDDGKTERLSAREICKYLLMKDIYQ